MGSTHSRARDVLFAGERAVEMEPRNGFYQDTRGLARALTGDTAGAIEDFRAFLEWGRGQMTEELLARRETWIRELEAGRDPFDPETLEQLRDD